MSPFHFPVSMRLRYAVALMGYLALLGGGVGCVSNEPLLVNFNEAAPRDSESDVGECVVSIAPVMDERLSGYELGTLGSQVIHGENVMPWVQHAVGTLTKNAGRNEGADRVRTSVRYVDLQLALKQLYVHPLLSSAGANILLAGRYRVDQEASQPALYRGTETGVNWTGSAALVVSLFDAAMDGILSDMRTDIRHLCQAQSKG